LKQFALALSRYWYLWSLIAALAAVLMLWLAYNTGNSVFVALAAAEGLLSGICVVLGHPPAPLTITPGVGRATAENEVNGRELSLTDL
jgi:hypothetical protein